MSADTSLVAPAGTRRRLATALTLFLVSAAMVYGTWLAVDDMRAKPMRAQVTLAADGLTVTNRGDFTWRSAIFTVNGTFRAEVPAPLAPGATTVIPLAAFVDASARALGASGERVRDVTARATRQSRFGTFNTDRPTTGRWLLE